MTLVTAEQFFCVFLGQQLTFVSALNDFQLRAFISEEIAGVSPDEVYYTIRSYYTLVGLLREGYHESR